MILLVLFTVFFAQSHRLVSMPYFFIHTEQTVCFTSVFLNKLFFHYAHLCYFLWIFSFKSPNLVKLDIYFQNRLITYNKYIKLQYSNTAIQTCFKFIFILSWHFWVWRLSLTAALSNWHQVHTYKHWSKMSNPTILWGTLKPFHTTQHIKDKSYV